LVKSFLKEESTLDTGCSSWTTAGNVTRYDSLGETIVEPKTKTNSRGDTGSEKESSMKEKTASLATKRSPFAVGLRKGEVWREHVLLPFSESFRWYQLSDCGHIEDT